MKSKLLPTVLDIETSGLDKIKCGIWQIGAIDLNTGKEFLQEARIDDEDLIEEGALIISGKTERELRNPNKQSQKELLERFFMFVEKRTLRNFLCQGPQFDVAFLDIKARKYGLKMPFHHRSFDLHTISQLIYMQLKGQFSTEEYHSKMSLSKIVEFCGIPNNRIELEKEKVTKQGKPHNALDDCKLEGECFSRLLSGKNLFSEYSQYKLPDYLVR